MKKEDLLEQVIELRAEMRRSTQKARHLARQNRRLSSALRVESEQFERLWAYVRSLREWLASRAPLYDSIPRRSVGIGEKSDEP